MANYNRVILMGNLTRDPQLRYTPSGQAVADFGLAINRRRRSSEGERRDQATFVEVTAWGRQAEVINEHFTKGRPIFLEGRLHLDEWTSQDGQRRSKLKVVLENFQFITPRAGPSNQPPRPRPDAPSDQPPRPRPDAEPPRRQAPPQPGPAPEAGAGEAPFDDVPF